MDRDWMFEPTYSTPGRRWSVELPVEEAERLDLTTTGYSHKGKQFRTMRLRIANSGWRDEIVWSVTGPLIKKDGGLGQIIMTANVAKADVVGDMPLTFRAAQEQLAALAVAVVAEVDKVVAQTVDAAMDAAIAPAGPAS